LLGVLLVGLVLFPITLAIAWQPWHPNLLALLAAAIFAVPFAGIGVIRLLAWLFPRLLEDRPSAPTNPPGLSSRLCWVERYRSTVPGVLFLWGMALVWNVPVGVLIAGAVTLWVRGRPPVPLLVFAAIFALVGVLLLVIAVCALLEEVPRLRGLRPPQVQLSAHPLRQGGSYELMLCQPGPIHLRLLRVALVCRVKVVVPDGEGGTYEKFETPFEVELVREEGLRVEPALPVIFRRAFSLPEGVKPSSQAEPEVQWKVVVQGCRAGWHLGFSFDYPVTVVTAEWVG
jgi:hypothetical protein